MKYKKYLNIFRLLPDRRSPAYLNGITVACSDSSAKKQGKFLPGKMACEGMTFQSRQIIKFDGGANSKKGANFPHEVL
jgi:hypothetical protein